MGKLCVFGCTLGINCWTYRSSPGLRASVLWNFSFASSIMKTRGKGLLMWSNRVFPGRSVCSQTRAYSADENEMPCAQVPASIWWWEISEVLSVWPALLCPRSLRHGDSQDAALASSGHPRAHWAVPCWAHTWQLPWESPANMGQRRRLILYMQRPWLSSSRNHKHLWGLWVVFLFDTLLLPFPLSMVLCAWQS